MERHGEHFFEAAAQATLERVYQKDREHFRAQFTREYIMEQLDEQGAFTMTYRLMDTGKPEYVNMKIMRMQPEGRYLIIGISSIDSQMRHQELMRTIQREEIAYSRVMALSGEYLGLYTIDPETGHYFDYIATKEYRSLGFAEEGEDFFRQGAVDGQRAVYSEDLPMYLEQFTRERVFRDIREKGAYLLRYRIVINGAPKQVLLKIVPVQEREGEKLVAGVREWRER